MSIHLYRFRFFTLTNAIFLFQMLERDFDHWFHFIFVVSSYSCCSSRYTLLTRMPFPQNCFTYIRSSHVVKDKKNMSHIFIVVKGQLFRGLLDLFSRFARFSFSFHIQCVYKTHHAHRSRSRLHFI